MKIKKDVSELIGHTPLLSLEKYSKKLGAKAQIIAKLESFNPAGSAKDRVAAEIISTAENNGSLKPGGVIIEPTSGNTGIAIAALACVKGYRAIIVMPDTMSIERRELIKAYGAELVLSDGKKGMSGAIEEADKLQSTIKGSIIAGQFVNPANPEAHRKTTGPEIFEDTDGTVSVFVAGIGTGGTITGVGEYLKSKNPEIKVIGVEPAGSPVISKGISGPHGLQGIGAGFIPKTLNTDIIDEIITVTEAEAYSAGRELAKTEGILAGISSGAALYAAGEIAKRPEYEGKRIVVLLPDTGDRYLSTPMFSE